MAIIPDTFWQVLTPLIVVITGLGQWLLSSWERKAIKETMSKVDQKADTLIQQTDGIVGRLQGTIEAKDKQASHVAELNEKDRQIAALTKTDEH